MSDQPSKEDLGFLEEMGMTEVEPGRWSSAWQGSDPGMQKWFDNLGGAGEEQLDLLTRAGRVQNEFDMERSGGAVASNVQLISEGPLLTLHRLSTARSTWLSSSASRNPAPGTSTPWTAKPSKRVSRRSSATTRRCHRQMRSPRHSASWESEARQSTLMRTLPGRMKVLIRGIIPGSVLLSSTSRARYGSGWTEQRRQSPGLSGTRNGIRVIVPAAETGTVRNPVEGCAWTE